MRIERHKAFLKAYAKLPLKKQLKVELVMELFAKDPANPVLKNHALIGKMEGKRSVSVGGDLRIIFEEFEHYTVVLMLDVGSHNQVY